MCPVLSYHPMRRPSAFLPLHQHRRGHGSFNSNQGSSRASAGGGPHSWPFYARNAGSAHFPTPASRCDYAWIQNRRERWEFVQKLTTAVFILLHVTTVNLPSKTHFAPSFAHKSTYLLPLSHIDSGSYSPGLPHSSDDVASSIGQAVMGWKRSWRI